MPPLPFTVIDPNLNMIPCAEANLSGYEDNVRGLLPNIMRVPFNCDCATIVQTVLSGVQVIDGVQGVAASTRVLVRNQDNFLENGPYTMQTGAWTRITATSQLTAQPWQPSSPDAGFRTVYYINRGTQAGFYYWLISPDPIVYGISPIYIEMLGTSLFAWHLQMAEREIKQDLDRPEKPITIYMLADRSQLTQAKVYKLYEILFRQAAANSQDGMPDRHERLSKVYAQKYVHEMSTTTLRLIDQARVRGSAKGKRIVRG